MIMNCEKCKNLIERYLDGTIQDAQLAELKSHTETCQDCREQFERCVLTEKAIKQAFSSQTTAEQAGASLVAKLSAETNTQGRRTAGGIVWLAGKQAAVAASIALALGLLAGFVAGKASTAKPTEAPPANQVPVRVGSIEGTVLVRHEGSEVWQNLKAGSNVYLGDTFHSAAKSLCVLKLGDKSTIGLNQNTMLVLKSYTRPEIGQRDGETQFFLAHGECTASLESPHGPFFIGTPHGRMEAVGTEFTVKVIDE